jgi:hypothetical protein
MGQCFFLPPLSRFISKVAIVCSDDRLENRRFFLLYCLLSTVYGLLLRESRCQLGKRWQTYFRVKNSGKHGENE